MNASEAKLLANNSDVLNIYLADVYKKIEESARRGNYELLYSDPPINLAYNDWDMLRNKPNIKLDFIRSLKVYGYNITDNSDERSAHKTITIGWE